MSRSVQLAAKHALDRVAAGVLLCCLAPFMLAIAADISALLGRLSAPKSRDARSRIWPLAVKSVRPQDENDMAISAIMMCMVILCMNVSIE